MAFIGRDVCKQVHADGEIKIARVEIAEVVSALGWNVMQNVVGQVTMRVNECDAVPKSDMLYEHVP